MSATQSVRDALARLDAAEGLGAVVARDDVSALAQAALPGSSAGPLGGWAITVKDWIDVAGLACEGQSPTRLDRRPIRDATAVARLRQAGAIVVAKTQPGADHRGQETKEAIGHAPSEGRPGHQHSFSRLRCRS